MQKINKNIIPTRRTSEDVALHSLLSNQPIIISTILGILILSLLGILLVG